MNIAIISIALGIALFVCSFLGYREGLRLGMQTAKGIEPPKIRSPITVIKEMKQEHEQNKEEKKYTAGLERLMNYTGDIEDEE